MGQVFGIEKIQRGHIPKLASFGYVADAARSILLPEPAVVAAVLFGSVIRGDSNIRSDVDCLVVYKTEKEETAMEVIHEVARVAHSLHVPVNIVPCDTELADTRLHHLGTSFVRHVDASIQIGGHIKGALDDLLTPTARAAEEIEWYIKMKMYNLQASYTARVSFTEEQRLAFLKKLLEAPMHIARKMLIYEGKLLGDSKKEVMDRYREVMSKHLAKQLDYLLELDARYNVELDCQLQKPDEKAYALTLGNLEKEVLNVLEFLRSNIIYLDRVR